MGLNLRAKLIATGVLGLLVLILPSSARASVGCTCPPQDQLGFPLGQSDISTDPIFCSYPAVEDEDPNDFFCTYSQSTGALVTDNDAGLCVASALNCSAEPTCGDNQVDAGESCDGSDLNGETCSTQGFTSGTLACDDQCAFDTMACDTCGDDVAGASESCDGSDLKGTSCSDLSFTGGTLACDSQCGFDTSGCTNAVCGDGVTDAGEQCDDGAANGAGSCCSSSCQLQNCSVGALKDSFVRTSQHNTNEGASTILALQNPGFNRPVLAFDLSGINTGALSKATLVVTISRNLGGWGSAGRNIEAHALNQDFSEGNGKILRQTGQTRGSGPGVTFECSTDAEIGNILKDCSGATAWKGGDFAAAASDSATIANKTKGDVSFDVTADVKDGKGDWLLRAANERQHGGVLFYSREGAAAAANPGLGPRLLLEYGIMCIGQC